MFTEWKEKAKTAFTAAREAVHNHFYIPPEERDVMIAEGMNPSALDDKDPCAKERADAAARCEARACSGGTTRFGRGGQ